MSERERERGGGGEGVSGLQTGPEYARRVPDIDCNSALHDKCFVVLLQGKRQAALTWPATASNQADMLVLTIVLLGDSARVQVRQANPTMDSPATNSNPFLFINRFPLMLLRSLASFHIFLESSLSSLQVVTLKVSIMSVVPVFPGMHHIW